MYFGFAILAQAGIHPLEHLAMTYKAIGGGGVDARGMLIRREKTLQRNCARKTEAQSGRTLRSEYRISAIFMGDWRRITQRCCPENGTYYLK